MAYDYNEYIKKYHKEMIKNVTVKFNRKHDADLVEILEKTDNQSRTIKELMRKGVKVNED